LHLPYTQLGKLGDAPIITTDIADPYHYHFADMQHAAKHLPYRVTLIGDWGHPRHQQMLSFEKMES
jgi:hypothetical protein